MVQIYLIGKELARRGWNVSHVVTTKNNKVVQSEEFDGMHIHYLKYRKYGELIGVYSFMNKLKEINADIYYQRGRAPMTGLVAYFAKHNGKKFVWSSAGEIGMAKGKYVNEQLRKKAGIRKILLYPYFWVQDRVYQYGIKYADIVFAQTEYQLKKLKKDFFRDGIIFSSGHDVPDKEVLKKTEPKIVLWIGAIKSSKQPELFLKLAQHLKSEKAKFIMIGRLNDERYADKISHQIKSQKNFQYIGEVPFDKVSEWFSKASITVNTTIPGYEGFPNVFIQSWLHGVPVISLHSDPDDLIKNHRIGYQTGNFESMIGKVREMIRNDRLLKELGIKARNYSIEYFGIERLVNRFLEIVEPMNNCLQ